MMNPKRLIFLAVWAVAQISAAAPALEEVVEKILPVSDQVTLEVRNTDGAIYVYGAEPGEIKLFARKKAYSQERLDGIEIKVTREGERVSIDTIYPPSPEGLSLADRSGTVEYIILVPEKCTVAEAELANGEIILQDLRGGGAKAGLTNGRIIARDCFCDVQLTVAAGALDIFYNWWETVRFALTAQIERGHIRAQVPLNPSLRIDAVSATGDVRVTSQKEDEGKNATHELKTTLGEEGGAEFTLRAASGNIEIEKGY